MQYDWLNKKTPRSVAQLRLWPENPRLTPGENHISLSDYVEDFTLEDADKTSFVDLAKAIANQGFIPFDPIVVWQNPDNEKFYVAEGNRRILVLKLFLEPNKAPRQYRGLFRGLAAKVNVDEISKVMVNVAPSFEDSIWYINQRNNNSSLQRSWGRVQQLRWINDLYYQFNGDLDSIISVTQMTLGGLESFIRILKIKDLVNEPIVVSTLGTELSAKAKSRNFPITILERLLSATIVRDRWGIQYNGIEVAFTSNRTSFLLMFAELIKRILLRDTVYKDSPERITTRTVTTHLMVILDSLPIVSFEPEVEPEAEETSNEAEDTSPSDSTSTASSDSSEEGEEAETVEQQRTRIRNDPNRATLIPDFYEISTTNHRLNELFKELQKVKYTYKNCIGAGLRVLLDLSVLNHINNEGYEAELRTFCRNAPLREITLKKRIEFLKQIKLTGRLKTIATRLNDETTEYSLDVLNGYVHGSDTHYMTKQFLNNFWGFLFPLLELFLGIREKNV